MNQIWIILFISIIIGKSNCQNKSANFSRFNDTVRYDSASIIFDSTKDVSLWFANVTSLFSSCVDDEYSDIQGTVSMLQNNFNVNLGNFQYNLKSYSNDEYVAYNTSRSSFDQLLRQIISCTVSCAANINSVYSVDNVHAQFVEASKNTSKDLLEESKIFLNKYATVAINCDPNDLDTAVQEYYTITDKAEDAIAASVSSTRQMISKNVLKAVDQARNNCNSMTTIPDTSTSTTPNPTQSDTNPTTTESSVDALNVINSILSGLSQPLNNLTADAVGIVDSVASEVSSKVQSGVESVLDAGSSIISLLSSLDVPSSSSESSSTYDDSNTKAVQQSSSGGLLNLKLGNLLSINLGR